MSGLLRMSLGCNDLKEKWLECNNDKEDCEEKFRSYYFKCLLMMGKPKMRLIKQEVKPK